MKPSKSKSVEKSKKTKEIASRVTVLNEVASTVTVLNRYALNDTYTDKETPSAVLTPFEMKVCDARLYFNSILGEGNFVGAMLEYKLQKVTYEFPFNWETQYQECIQKYRNLQPAYMRQESLINGGYYEFDLNLSLKAIQFCEGEFLLLLRNDYLIQLYEMSRIFISIINAQLPLNLRTWVHEFELAAADRDFNKLVETCEDFIVLIKQAWDANKNQIVFESIRFIILPLFEYLAQDKPFSKDKLAKLKWVLRLGYLVMTLLAHIRQREFELLKTDKTLAEDLAQFSNTFRQATQNYETQFAWVKDWKTSMVSLFSIFIGTIKDLNSKETDVKMALEAAVKDTTLYKKTKQALLTQPDFDYVVEIVRASAATSKNTDLSDNGSDDEAQSESEAELLKRLAISNGKKPAGLAGPVQQQTKSFDKKPAETSVKPKTIKPKKNNAGANSAAATNITIKNGFVKVGETSRKIITTGISWINKLMFDSTRTIMPVTENRDDVVPDLAAEVQKYAEDFPYLPGQAPQEAEVKNAAEPIFFFESDSEDDSPLFGDPIAVSAKSIPVEPVATETMNLHFAEAKLPVANAASGANNNNAPTAIRLRAPAEKTKQKLKKRLARYQRFQQAPQQPLYQRATSQPVLQQEWIQIQVPDIAFEFAGITPAFGSRLMNLVSGYIQCERFYARVMQADGRIGWVLWGTSQQDYISFPNGQLHSTYGAFFVNYYMHDVYRSYVVPKLQPQFTPNHLNPVVPPIPSNDPNNERTLPTQKAKK